MKKKIIISGMLVVIILAIGIGFWVWKKNEIKKQEQSQLQQEKANKNQENTDIDMSDWKTYKDEKYGFEFNYPPNLTPKFQNEYGNVKLDVIFNENELKADSKYLAFTLKVFNNQKGENNTIGNGKFIKIGVDGDIPALREFVLGSTQDAPFETVSFNVNNLKFYYVFWNVGERISLENSKFKQDEERILSSFKSKY
jgi:hypothetical protein